MRVALIGYGGIGAIVAKALLQQKDTSDILIVAVLVRPERLEAAKARDTLDLRFVSTIDELLRTDPDIVAECAGHSAVKQFGAKVLGAGIDFVVASAGALADDALHSKLLRTAKANHVTMHVPSGALAGMDGLTAARHGGLFRVSYTGRKPPSAWTGTPAEDTADLNQLAGEKTIFSGSARDAALQFPKNSNVAAIVALAGIGFDETEVNLIADSGVSENQHHIEVQAETGNFEVALSGKTLLKNPKTSALAAYSVVKCLLDQQSTVDRRLLGS